MMLSLIFFCFVSASWAAVGTLCTSCVAVDQGNDAKEAVARVCYSKASEVLVVANNDNYDKCVQLISDQGTLFTVYVQQQPSFGQTNNNTCVMKGKVPGGTPTHIDCVYSLTNAKASQPTYCQPKEGMCFRDFK